MTKITTVSKKMLSLIMALLMIGSAVAFSASATDEDTPAKPDYTLDAENRTITVKNPADGAEITIEPADKAQKALAENGVDILFFNLVYGT